MRPRPRPLAALAFALAGCVEAAAPTDVHRLYVVTNGLGGGTVTVQEDPRGCGLDCPDLYGRGVAVSKSIARPAS